MIEKKREMIEQVEEQQRLNRQIQEEMVMQVRDREKEVRAKEDMVRKMMMEIEEREKAVQINERDYESRIEECKKLLRTEKETILAHKEQSLA
jgi:hypothetical protein